jgi:para-aminobenzoate synthetase component 1
MTMIRKNIPWPTPDRLARWVMAGPHRVWLDSALQSHPRARQSILCGSPLIQWQWNPDQNQFSQVEEWMNIFSPEADHEKGFCGGVVGYLSYESWPPDLPWSRRVYPHLPAAHFMAVDTGLILDHSTQAAHVFSWGLDEHSGNSNRELARERCESLSEELLSQGEEGMKEIPSQVEVDFQISKNKYLECIAQIKEAIARGDFYQVNYAHPVAIKGLDDPAELYLSWRLASPAPQMAFWNLPEGQILSASPEILLQVSSDRTARSFPIKGTRPRGVSAAQDEALKHELLHSEKDGAELLMIVDLVRNDLGKVCEVGSIAVPRLKALESFPHIHHLVAEVNGKLSDGVTPLQALRALFPGGSITGAPKRKAMEWIRELEGRPRGIYTGSIGYWSFNGEACFNIAIRSGFFRQGVMEYWSGSGIVADSVAEAEYEETFDKLKGLLKSLGKDVRINLS